jgi:hypothetical protein
MKKLLLLGALVCCVSVVASPATAQAETPATVSVTPVELRFFNQCLGHIIDVSAELRLVYRLDENGVVILSNSVIAGLRVFDSVTGETYVFSQVSTYVLNFTAEAGYNITFQVTGVFVGGTSSFLGKAIVHATITPSGTTTANFEFFELTCM